MMAPEIAAEMARLRAVAEADARAGVPPILPEITEAVAKKSLAWLVERAASDAANADFRERQSKTPMRRASSN